MPAIMAKKKPKGRPKVDQPRGPITSFKGSPEFADWFARLVDHCRIPATSVIEKALIVYARQEGFNEEAPRR